MNSIVLITDDGGRYAGEPMELDTVTSHQAAKLCDVMPTTVKRWIWRGLIPGHRVGGKWKIYVDDMSDFLDSRGMRNPWRDRDAPAILYVGGDVLELEFDTIDYRSIGTVQTCLYVSNIKPDAMIVDMVDADIDLPEVWIGMCDITKLRGVQIVVIGATDEQVEDLHRVGLRYIFDRGDTAGISAHLKRFFL